MNISKNLLIVFVAVIMLHGNNSVAQSNTAVSNLNFSIPPVAILAIETDNTISFSSPSQVGVVITPESSKNSWINYSSVVNSGTSNKITVNISSGQLPESTSIKLMTGNYVGDGAGNLGTPVSEITLSESPQDIITNIGSCYTGTGLLKGHQLTYSWIVDKNYSNNESDSGNVIALTYTILSSE